MKMLSKILRTHFQRVAMLYPAIPSGQNLTPPGQRSQNEIDLLKEITQTQKQRNGHMSSLGRTRPHHISTGRPKGAWAHIYYVSIHDPINSYGPTEGFYPAFLMSIDQRTCWLSLLIAAASEGISGRGGWSIKRGKRLKNRAHLLSDNLSEKDGWKKGPILLGTMNTSLHGTRGNSHSAGRAYECGAIISKSFDPIHPPSNLSSWLLEAFKYFDVLVDTEATYIETILPQVSGQEEHDQANAIITGKNAEMYFLDWVQSTHPEWGPPEDKTDRVGLGYDVRFPKAGFYVEIKGCKDQLENIRLLKENGKPLKKRATTTFYALCLRW